MDLASLFNGDISQQWVVMAGILTVYFLKDKIFDEVAMAKFFAQRRVAKSDSKGAVSQTSHAARMTRKDTQGTAA